jgi:5-methylcytosine-specific restriction endonuclease McrA
MRGEVDEINPVSKGGSPTLRSNCQLAHRACNELKGNRDHILRPAEPVTPYPLAKEY